MDLKIKVCGMKYASNINAVSALIPDYLGFIFYTKSKRFVGLDFDKSDLANLHPSIQKVAVFVNAHLNEVTEFSNIYGIKTIQLHGNESSEFCSELKKSNFKIIKAFGVDENFDFSNLEVYQSVVDYFLFDTKTPEHGGSGKTFDWNILNQYKLDIPFLLSGGLSLENISEVKSINHPKLYGVDLNSRFEIEPGVKNTELLEEAFKIIRS